jgi:beta-lactamase regulating signal transducer with metallopeptidase domain
MNTISISHLLVDAAVKSAVVLLVAALLALLMRRASAAVRHLIWTAGVVLALLLPIGSLMPPSHPFVLPTWNGDAALPDATDITSGRQLPRDLLNEIDPAETESNHAQPLIAAPAGFVPSAILSASGNVEAVQAQQHAVITASQIAVSIWIIGAILVAMYWLVGFFAARKMRRGAPCVESGPLFIAMRRAQQQLVVHRAVTLRVGPDVGMPLTAHTWRPQIFLPVAAEDWSDAQVQSAMLHEMAHVKRFDCAVQWITNWACAVYWFNPLIWIAAARLRLERERACDDLVLNQGADPTSYAEHLLAVARVLRGGFHCQTGAIAMARPSGLRQRLIDILDQRVNRRALSAWSVCLAALTILVAGIPLSCVQLGAKNKAKPQQTAATRPAATQPIVGQTGAFQSQPGPVLHLTVVNTETGAPVAGAGINYGYGGPDIAKTDAQGDADVPMGGHATISVWCSHYINHRLSWAHGVPAEYTYRLDPASTIGGKVVDDAGQPVEGANVEIYVNGSGTHQRDEFIEMPWVNRAVTTDADGKWHFDRVPLHPAKPIKIAVWDYQHLDGNLFFLNNFEPQSALRDQTATSTLHKSVVINGSVVDPFYGKPIVGAKVAFGEDQSSSNKIPPLTVGKDGNFKIAAQAGSKLILTVTADGYRPEVKQQVVGDKAEDWEFDLSPTNWVK